MNKIKRIFLAIFTLAILLVNTSCNSDPEPVDISGLWKVTNSIGMYDPIYEQEIYDQDIDKAKEALNYISENWDKIKNAALYIKSITITLPSTAVFDTTDGIINGEVTISSEIEAPKYATFSLYTLPYKNVFAVANNQQMEFYYPKEYILIKYKI
jgi:hypothetical protein